jgi:sugar O-acyltransferase (sialic acid O-acetyltransferase NeuD family)
MNIHAQKSSCPIAIFGAGGHAVSVANVATSAGFRVSHFIDSTKTGSYLLDLPVVGDISEIGGAGAKQVSIAVGDNSVRERVYHELISRDKDLLFPPLVHKSAVVSVFCEVEAGVVIMPGVIVGPNTKIGRFCLLNTRSSIDHDSQMGDFSSLAPGVVTGGTVRIGNRSAISIGATIKHGISVGDDVVIGAGSYLNKDAPNNSVMYGTPARLIRNRANNDPYLQ